MKGYIFRFCQTVVIGVHIFIKILNIHPPAQYLFHFCKGGSVRSIGCHTQGGKYGFRRDQGVGSGKFTCSILLKEPDGKICRGSPESFIHCPVFYRFCLQAFCQLRSLCLNGSSFTGRKRKCGCSNKCTGSKLPDMLFSVLFHG